MVWRDLEKSERQSSGQSQSNGGKKGIPAEEVNIEVRRILRGNPSWDWTVKKLTEKVKKDRGGPFPWRGRKLPCMDSLPREKKTVTG